eukprot:6446517-Amphidinium_carterae.1
MVSSDGSYSSSSEHSCQEVEAPLAVAAQMTDQRAPLPRRNRLARPPLPRRMGTQQQPKEKAMPRPKITLREAHQDPWEPFQQQWFSEPQSIEGVMKIEAKFVPSLNHFAKQTLAPIAALLGVRILSVGRRCAETVIRVMYKQTHERKLPIIAASVADSTDLAAALEQIKHHFKFLYVESHIQADDIAHIFQAWTETGREAQTSLLMVLRGAVLHVMANTTICRPAAILLFPQAHNVAVLVAPLTCHSERDILREIQALAQDYLNRNPVRAEGRQWSLTLSFTLRHGAGRDSLVGWPQEMTGVKLPWYSLAPWLASLYRPLAVRMRIEYSFSSLLEHGYSFSSWIYRGYSLSSPPCAGLAHRCSSLLTSEVRHGGGRFRCIITGDEITIANPEKLRRRLAWHKQNNDVIPQVRPIPIDYAADEEPEEQQNLRNKLQAVRDFLMRECSSMDGWKQVAFTPGRVEETEEGIIDQLPGQPSSSRPSIPSDDQRTLTSTLSMLKDGGGRKHLLSLADHGWDLFDLGLRRQCVQAWEFLYLIMLDLPWCSGGILSPATQGQNYTAQRTGFQCTFWWEFHCMTMLHLLLCCGGSMLRLDAQGDAPIFGTARRPQYVLASAQPSYLRVPAPRPQCVRDWRQVLDLCLSMAVEMAGQLINAVKQVADAFCACSSPTGVDSSAPRVRQGGAKCWSISDSNTCLHEHVDPHNVEPVPVVRAVRVHPTSPSLSMSPPCVALPLLPHLSIPEDNESLPMANRRRPGYTLARNTSLEWVSSHISAFCQAARCLHFSADPQQLVHQLEHFVRQQMQLGKCGKALSEVLKQVAHLPTKFWRGTGVHQCFFKGAMFDLAALSHIRQISIT